MRSLSGMCQGLPGERFEDPIMLVVSPTKPIRRSVSSAPNIFPLARDIFERRAAFGAAMFLFFTSDNGQKALRLNCVERERVYQGMYPEDLLDSSMRRAFPSTKTRAIFLRAFSRMRPKVARETRIRLAAFSW